MMPRRTWVSFALVAAALGATAIPASAAVYVTVAPPEPRHEIVPPPRHGYIWVPGYWNWNGHAHVWVPGTWVRARSGYYYAEPAWAQHDGHWVLQRGHWARGDRDHDGVPNRVDHHPDDPYRR